jgi:hypothetical protein
MSHEQRSTADRSGPVTAEWTIYSDSEIAYSAGAEPARSRLNVCGDGDRFDSKTRPELTFSYSVHCC